MGWLFFCGEVGFNVKDEPTGLFFNDINSAPQPFFPFHARMLMSETSKTSSNEY